MMCRFEYARLLLRCEGTPRLRGHPQHEIAARHVRILRHKRLRSDYRVIAYAAPAEQHRAHSHQYAVAHRRGVDDGAVSHGHVLANDSGAAFLSMDDGVILYIGARPYRDRGYIAPQHRAEPHARPIAQCYIANEGGGGGDVAVLTYL